MAPADADVPIDPVASHARRDGDDVRVVLTLDDDLSAVAGEALFRRRVWLRAGHRAGDGEPDRVRVLAEVTRAAKPVVVARLPLERLARGTWNLWLRIGQGGRLVRLEARLLVTDPAVQPLALLVGPRPDTRMPAPAARQR